VVAELVVQGAQAATMGYSGKATVTPEPALTAVRAATTQVDGRLPGWGRVVAVPAAAAVVLVVVVVAALPIIGRPAWAAAAADARYLAESPLQATEVYRRIVLIQIAVTQVTRIIMEVWCLY